MKKILIAGFAATTMFFSCKKAADVPATPQVGAVQADALVQNAPSTSVSFGSSHPCGLAVSKKGKVAVSTYEGDNSPGNIDIWFKFSDFLANKAPNSTFQIIDPEAIAFDANEALFISSTVPDQIFYKKDVTANVTSAPVTFIGDPTSPASIGNPRGLTFDDANNLIAVYEGYGAFNSAVYKFSNPVSGPLTATLLIGQSSLMGARSLGVAIGHTLGGASQLTYVTNYGTGTSATQNVKEFTDVTPIPYPVNHTTANNGGIVFDIAITNDVSHQSLDTIYCTAAINGKCYLEWQLIPGFKPFSNLQQPICTENGFDAWGVATFGQYVVVADAPENKVKVFLKKDLSFYSL